MFWAGSETLVFTTTLMRLIFCVAALTALSGCALRTIRPPAVSKPPDAGDGYIDLQRGWRLRVVTPLLKSGGYLPNSIGEQIAGNTITLRAGADLLGYETAYYAVKARDRTGARVLFSSAEITKDGLVTPQPRPVAGLFQLPRWVKFVRLVYLQRASQADHNMAILASNRIDTLARLTGQVEANPAACKTYGSDFCSWIPVGIAVRPEVQRVVQGVKEWVPAR
jgi:hypothetical protein